MQRQGLSVREQCEELAGSTDDETLTSVSLDDESDDAGNASLVDLGPTRRNPPRASRPSDLAE